MKRRDFLKKTGTGAGVAAAAAGSVAYAPHVIAKKKTTIRWRIQTYAGAALAAHVLKPGVDMFNKAADGEMRLDMYTSDELVPQDELFRAVQQGTIDAAQSDDDSMAAPADVASFAAYFPFASRYSMDVSALFEEWGLNEIWQEAYGEIPGVTWLGAASWDPCNFASRDPIRSMDDFKGKRMFMFPTAGKFMQQYGVVPVVLPFEQVQVALQTGQLDGVCWSGITEDYNNGWADVTSYYLTNAISGAWIGSWFANSDRWEALPDHLQNLYRMMMQWSNYYRLYWYWAGEAKIRAQGKKLKLTSIPTDEWNEVEDNARTNFWEEYAQKSERCAKVISIFREYNETMRKVGPPYRYGSGLES